MSGHFEQYKQQYAAIKAMDPNHPVFILDCPWITSPATEWWCACIAIFCSSDSGVGRAWLMSPSIHHPEALDLAVA